MHKNTKSTKIPMSIQAFHNIQNLKSKYGLPKSTYIVYKVPILTHILKIRKKGLGRRYKSVGKLRAKPLLLKTVYSVNSLKIKRSVS